MDHKPWLKHYPKEIPHTLSYESGLLQEILQKTSEKYPEDRKSTRLNSSHR